MLGVLLDESDSYEEEQEDPLFDFILHVDTLPSEWIVAPQAGDYLLVQLDVELIFDLAREDEEGNPLDGVAPLVGEEASAIEEAHLLVPPINLALDHILQALLGQHVLDDALPLAKVEHGHLEEVIVVEDVLHYLLIWREQL